MSSDLPVGLGRQHAGIKLRRAYEAFTAAVFERLAARGFDDLRPAHAQVFQHLTEDGIRLTHLARAAGVTPQSMASLVDDLERLGYIGRKGDPSDRRAALIRPTDRGRAEVRAAREVIGELEREWSDAVGDKRFADLLEDLATLEVLLAGRARTTEPDRRSHRALRQSIRASRAIACRAKRHSGEPPARVLLTPGADRCGVAGHRDG